MSNTAKGPELSSIQTLKPYNMFHNDVDTESIQKYEENRKKQDSEIIEDVSNTDFKSIISNYVVVPQQAQQRKRCDTDKLLFKMEDVLAVSHPLARLMRMILFDNKVTEIMFNEKHKQYAESAGYMTIQINYHRNNIKKAMDKKAISFRTFETVISLIMKFSIKDIKMDFMDEDGKIKRYGLLDILVFADKYYNNPNPEEIIDMHKDVSKEYSSFNL